MRADGQSNADDNCAAVPATVTIPAGSRSASFSIETTVTVADQLVTINTVRDPAFSQASLLVLSVYGVRTYLPLLLK